MKKLSISQEELLLRFLDGELSEEEVKLVKNQIDQSPELQNRYIELKTVHSFLSRKIQLDEPPKLFTQTVMNGLDRNPELSNNSYKNGIYLLAGILIASALAIMLLLNGVFTETTSSLVIDATSIQNKWMTLPTLSIPFNVKIIINGIIFLNLGIALILFDRTVLKPYFQKRIMIH
jgi:hypothetical protein